MFSRNLRNHFSLDWTASNDGYMGIHFATSFFIFITRQYGLCLDHFDFFIIRSLVPFDIGKGCLCFLLNLDSMLDFAGRHHFLFSAGDNLPPWVHSTPRHNQARWEPYARIPILRLHTLSWSFLSMHYSINNSFPSQTYSRMSRGILGSGEVQGLEGDPLDHLLDLRGPALWPFVDVGEPKQAIQPKAQKLLLPLLDVSRYIVDQGFDPWQTL